MESKSAMGIFLLCGLPISHPHSASRQCEQPAALPERRYRTGQLVRLVREAGSPESPQTIFLGGYRLLHARDDALPQRQLCIEFGAHLSKAQVGGAEQITAPR
jgi:hypothetical protein